MSYSTLDSRHKRHSKDRQGNGLNSLKRAASANSLGRANSFRSNTLNRAATTLQIRDNKAVIEKQNQIQLHVKIPEKKVEVQYVLLS